MRHLSQTRGHPERLWIAPNIDVASAGIGGRRFASPLARRIAAERGVDLAGVAGSGPNGRIVKADVELHVAALAATLAAYGRVLHS